MRVDKFKQYFATVLVVVLSLFLLYVIYKFINGFFGAVLLYILLLPLYNFLIKKEMSHKFAAVLIVFVAFFIIIAPLLTILIVIGNQLFGLLQNPTLIAQLTTIFNDLLAKVIPSLGESSFAGQISNLAKILASTLVNVVSNIGSFIINLFISLFLLYYMLINGPLLNKFEKILPFNKKNARALVQKIKDVSYSTVLVGGIVALLQGTLLTISFLIFGIPNAFLWGFFATVLSFLPVVGPPIIWVPAVVVKIIESDYVAGIGILIFGLILSNVDNFIRPYLGNKISSVHPLVTLIGIFAGVSMFGLMGLFIGPLFLALAILVLKMFKEEYIK